MNLAAWVCRDIDWHGFGRTRGGWVDRHGRLADPPEERPTPAVTAIGGFCAPMSPFYAFGPSGPAERWDSWVEWSPPFPRFSELLPLIRATRGPIRFGTP